MNQHKGLKRGLLAAVCAAIFVIVILLINRETTPPVHGDPGTKPPEGWKMFGGTLQRNFVNTDDKDMPETWDVAKKDGIKWTADLGSKA